MDNNKYNKFGDYVGPIIVLIIVFSFFLVSIFFAEVTGHLILSFIGTFFLYTSIALLVVFILTEKEKRSDLLKRYIVYTIISTVMILGFALANPNHDDDGGSSTSGGKCMIEGCNFKAKYDGLCSYHLKMAEDAAERNKELDELFED